ncbi:MAG: 16S rRNA (cytidine(1402)-2'-O)-methyltransferase [Halanaerobiaceae bacterium]
MEESGKLYICGTPIGNLEDITFRAVRILKKVDLIAAEDTRKTRKLLTEYDIDTQLISYHEHNEKERAVELVARISEGTMLALVSNAGMPGISDPGSEVIKRALEQGIEVFPVPGPTALISALVVSGLPMERFVFEGFLPRQGQQRGERLRKIKKEQRTTIVYESPYRIKDTLKDLESEIGGRKIALVRELTKVYEEKLYGTPQKLLERVNEKEIKGEIVLVIAGRKEAKIERCGWEDYSIVEHVRLLMDQGYTKKEAIKKVAGERDVSRKKVYKEAIAINVDPENF